MTDTAQIIQTIRALFDIVANSERDSDEVREALAELAKDPSFLLLLRGVAEEIGGGIHIHIHESHHHSHTHVPQREKERQPYNPYVINPTVTWEEKIPIEPITVAIGQRYTMDDAQARSKEDVISFAEAFIADHLK